MILTSLSGLLVTVTLAASTNLERAKANYKQLDFEKCITETQAARTQRAPLTPAEQRDLELFSGLCQFNLGKAAEAKQLFKAALKLDASTELPPYTSPKAVELFTEIKRASAANPVPSTPFQETDFPSESQKPKEPAKPESSVPVAKESSDGEPDEALGKWTASPLREPAQTVRLDNASVFDRRPLTTPIIVLGALSITSFLVGLALGLTASDVRNSANAAPFDAEFIRQRQNALGLATGANIAYGVAGVGAIATFIGWWFFPPAQTSTQ